MKKIADLLVKGRYILLAAFTVIAVCSIFLMQKVNVNSDMSKYLPDNSSMKKGVDVMGEEFPNQSSESSVIRLMIDNLDETKKLEIYDELQKIENVTSVDYDTESKDYNKDEHTLYVISSTYGYDSDEFKQIEETIDENYSENYDSIYATNEIKTEGIPVPLLLLALAIMLIIMILMCGSYIEPFIFLLSIGFAVLINMGTNYFLPSVSETTNSIASILQLVLSMDYSIILSNRYRQSKKLIANKNEAMKDAVYTAIPSVCSSSLTTIVGLLALVFMSFKIGADLGIVLAKGVLISLICVFTVLPPLLLICEKLIQKTTKNALTIPMDGLAKLSFKGRYVISGLFVLIFVGVFIAKGGSGISYSMPAKDDVSKVFAKTNTIVLMYDNDDENKINEVIDKVQAEENVSSVNSYGTTIGKTYSAAELAMVMQGMAGNSDTGMSLNETVMQMLFYDAFGDRSNEKMTMEQLIGFLQNLMTDEHSEFAGEMDDETKQQLQQFSAMKDNPVYTQECTAEEMSQIFAGFTDKFDASYINLLYELYFTNVNYDDLWKMSIEQFCTQISSSKTFASLLDDSMKEQMSGMMESLAEGKAQMVGENYSIAAINTSFIDGSEESLDFMESLEDNCDEILTGKYYLIGNTPMAYEMSQTFGNELNKITIITAIAIFIVVMITFRSLTIPLILVLLIQSSVYITMVVMRMMGVSMYYMALLIVQSILMGATIDYAIVFTNYYREKRADRDILPALKSSYKGSFRTILTSGLIMVFATWIVGYAFADPAIGQICHIISIGVVCALVMILGFLPGILAALDKLIISKKNK